MTSVSVLSATLVYPLCLETSMNGLESLIGATGDFISQAILVFAGAGLLVFLYGLVKFIFRLGGSEAKVEEGKNMMIWGLVALFVMVSVWGLVRFFQESLGITNIDL